ncbi:MAG: flavodoxin domain-containing protein [Alteromonadaceae bacterium]|nr:flavodoxin domain-containing protein [Alteromonadaceae bacterium]
MASFQIIVGSMMGGSEYVAEACEEIIIAKGHQATINFQPDFSHLIQQITQKDQIWLIVTSTHGAGDYPDNIQNFVTDLGSYDQDLSSITFLMIGLGDSNYDTFCHAAKKIEKILISKNCKTKNKILILDMSLDIDPEALAQTWITQVIDHL